jgi:hypothetical protein
MFYDESSKIQYVVKAVDFSEEADEVVVIKKPVDGEAKAPGTTKHSALIM